jgi:nucleoid-associated protein YgaU
MTRRIISKIVAGLLLLLLAGGCTSVYTWWDVPLVSQHREPAPSPSNAAPPSPFIDPDSRPADNPVPAASLEPPVHPSQTAGVPASTPKPITSKAGSPWEPLNQESPSLVAYTEFLAMRIPSVDALPIQIYTVKPRDSYWSIARQFYENSQSWQVLYKANRNQMRNPDKTGYNKVGGNR